MQDNRETLTDPNIRYQKIDADTALKRKILVGATLACVVGVDIEIAIRIFLDYTYPLIILDS